MNAAVSKLIETSRAHLMGVDVVDLKRLRELANDVIEHSVDGCCMSVLAEYAFHEAANPATIIAMADEIEALRAIAEAPRGTNAQILMEREITASSIQGAMAFGYQNTNPPPAEDHWLQSFWDIGRKQAEMECEIEALRELRDAVITQREMYADTSDEDNMSGKRIAAALDRVVALASKGGGV
jgi:hypothetical protein